MAKNVFLDLSKGTLLFLSLARTWHTTFFISHFLKRKKMNDSFFRMLQTFFFKMATFFIFILLLKTGQIRCFCLPCCFRNRCLVRNPENCDRWWCCEKNVVVVDDLLMLLTLCKKTYHLSLSLSHTHTHTHAHILSLKHSHTHCPYSSFNQSLLLTLLFLSTSLTLSSSLSRTTQTLSLSQHCFRTTGQLLQLF